VWRITDRLYLGDYESGCSALMGTEASTDPDGRSAPFAGVVSLCPVPLLPDHDIEGPVRRETEWLHLPILDGGNGEEEFESAMEVALPFIARRRKQGNVLVHCAAGMSRSVSIIAAVLCSENGRSVQEAFDFVAGQKAQALSYPHAAELVIAPAWEFRACLRRLYPR
jgi:hypothetical protein